MDAREFNLIYEVVYPLFCCHDLFPSVNAEIKQFNGLK